MIKRIQKLSREHSFFLFGARGTGKTTLLKHIFSGDKKDKTLWINLLSFDEEDRLEQNPDLLTQMIEETPYERIIIDEVQKVPKILDIVHIEIEKDKKRQFILTGSSARKLKRGSANMLGGRLFTFSLHPFTHLELGNKFSLDHVLQWGSLPGLNNYKTSKDKIRYLNSYIHTYLKEEIIVEQLIRKKRPFKNFLEISAQYNGQIINYSKMARSLGVDYTTIQTYFDILTDTYLGFYLHGFHRSIRKQQIQAPKFFLFDLGVTRALLNRSQIPLEKGNYDYGKAFEHFVILECFRLNNYYEKQYRISYLKDKEGHEIDLIIQKPTGEEILVEIKSSKSSTEDQGKRLEKFLKLWDRPCQAQLWSKDPKNRKIGLINHYHWETGLKKIFLNEKKTLFNN